MLDVELRNLLNIAVDRPRNHRFNQLILRCIEQFRLASHEVPEADIGIFEAARDEHRLAKPRDEDDVEEGPRPGNVCKYERQDCKIDSSSPLHFATVRSDSSHSFDKLSFSRTAS